VHLSNSHRPTLRLYVAGPLVDFEQDDRDNERDAVERSGDPAVDGVLIIEVLDVFVAVVTTRPLRVINRQIFGQRRRPNFEEYSEQCLHLHQNKHTNSLKHA